MYSSPHKTSLFFALLLTIIGTGTFLYYGLHWALSYIAAINLATMLTYLYDKSISHTEAVRVPEKVLHLLSILGGSPGALLASKLFRHKTQKTGFQLVQWLIVLIQVAILAYISYTHYFPG